MSRRAAVEKARRRIDTDPRISQRRREVGRTRRRRILSVVAVVAALGAAVWLAFFSPLLKVRDVVVVGGAHTSSADAAAAAGLDDGDSLLLVSTTKVEEAVRSLPWVASARVDRKLPGTVRIKIRERRPALLVQVGDGSWTVDATGRVLQRGRAGNELPLLTGVATAPPVPGERLGNTNLRAALRVWRSLPDQIRDDVVALYAPSPERISFSLRDRTLVRYGAATGRRTKRQVLKALLARLREQRRAAAYIDIRVPTRPALVPLEQAPPGSRATPPP